MIRKGSLIGCLLICLFARESLAKDFPITDYGAKPGPEAMNTEPINEAIQACYSYGGGRVIIPAGVFRSGTILMKENVELHLEMGAVLLASTDLKDFPVQPQPAYRSQKDPGGWRALIYANDVSNIAITGSGAIDGNGAKHKPDPNSKFKSDLDGRPRNILFISCKQVRVEGIRMRNSAIWNQHYLNCEDVVVDRINVYNHANRNNDGIDIDGCRRFTLSNSTFDTDDDAIVLKSTGAAACEDVVITNCIVSSFCNAIKAGTESTGGFKNITISNCVIKPSTNAHPPIYGTARGITGLSLEIVDGGVMEGVSISNITIEGTDCPLFIRLGNRARKHTEEAPLPPVGIMRNIMISNVTAYQTGNYSSSITAIPGHYIENVSLSNIQFYNKGGLKPGSYISDIEKVKEDEKGYPQPTVWKELPSSALFIRHAKNVQINGLMLGSEKTDPRVPVVAADVDGLQIQQIGKITNSGADVFFKGWNVEEIAIDTPLGWKQKVVELSIKDPLFLTQLRNCPGLVALWDFKEKAGHDRVSSGKEKFKLKEKTGVVPRVPEGPLSGFAIQLDGTNYLSIPYAETGALNVKNNSVTVIAWVKWMGTGIGFIAGMWNEYHDGGKRQYGLFVNLPHYNGERQVCGHISKTGQPTPPFPYSIDYSASKQLVVKGEWSCVAFTYDGKYIRSYLNGIFEARKLELIRNTKGFENYPNGLIQVKNPYYFPYGIGDNGSDFTVGAVQIASGMSNFFTGLIGGLAVFNRALTDHEMKRIAVVPGISK